MKMKKMISVLAAMFLMSTAAYALDMSVGVSGGVGAPFLRGDLQMLLKIATMLQPKLLVVKHHFLGMHK